LFNDNILLMLKKLRPIGRLFTFIFVVWGLYRLIFRLPENVEEIVLKPLIWLVPTFYLVFKKEKRGMESLGYTNKNLKKSIGKGLIFSLFFLVVGISLNYLKNGFFSFGGIFSKDIFWPTVLLSFITAISEETVFRCYIFNRMAEILKNDWLANLISSVGFCLVYLPISVFVYHYNLPQIFIFLTLTFLFSIGSGVLFSWTGSIWSSILVHVFWAWPAILVQ